MSALATSILLSACNLVQSVDYSKYTQQYIEKKSQKIRFISRENEHESPPKEPMEAADHLDGYEILVSYTKFVIFGHTTGSKIH